MYKLKKNHQLQYCIVNTNLFIVNQVAPSWVEESQIYTLMMVDFSLTYINEDKRHTHNTI
jgi:hypothetical protein